MKLQYLKQIAKHSDFEKETIADQTIISAPGKVRKVGNKSISYTERHRGVWFRPEYDLHEIQIAQDTDGYLFRAIKKKVNRFLTAGWEIVGVDPEVVSYIKKRIAEMQYVSQMPWNLLLSNTASDLIRFSNCMWVKARSLDSSSGKRRKIFDTLEVDPVAGYFILPFETLAFKTKRNGEIKKIRQRMPSGDERYFNPQDVIHFYENRKPGFAMGTPELTPVLDDISLLRRIEENVEDLIESNLYPLFHYTVGSDSFPERYSPEGYKETDIVKNTIDYMPAGGIYVSDHRHKITAIGSEGRALRIEGYLEYFKKRVIAGLGLSSVDMGEGDTANRSTANALSQSAIQDVEALQQAMKNFIEFFVFNELLLEGGYDPLEANNKVEIRFGIVDRENRSKLENQTIQLWLNNLLSENEARQRLGYAPNVDKEDTHFKLYQEPLALLKVMGPFNAASKALSESKTSSINEEGLAKEESNESGRNEARGQKGLMQKKGPENLSNNISRPANQTGIRSAPKFSSDIYYEINNTVEDIESFFENRLDNKKESTLEYTIVGLEKNELIFDFIVEVKNILKNLKYNNKNINIEDVQTSDYAVIYNFCKEYKAKLINSEKK
jgi:hypothetical protein